MLFYYRRIAGQSDNIYERLKEFDLIQTLIEFDGIVMGCSVGTVIQFFEYYISSIKEYPQFSYYPGLPYLNNFYIEVHYAETKTQKDCIDLERKERNKPIYAMQNTGAIIVDHGSVQLLGHVKVFR